jgi:hypothetical protein
MKEFKFITGQGERVARISGGYSSRRGGSAQVHFLLPFQVFENERWRPLSLALTEERVLELRNRQIDILNDEQAMQTLFQTRYYESPDSVTELHINGTDVDAAFGKQQVSA